MSNAAPVPTAGFVFEKLYAVEQTHHLVDPKQADLPEDDRPLTIRWDWRLLDDDQIEVSVGLKIDASRSVPEIISGTMVGRFRRQEPATMALVEFVRLNAIALLVPYAREIITSLSARGPYGPMVVPPLNVAGLAADFKDENTTGFRQLQERQPATAEKEDEPRQG